MAVMNPSKLRNILEMLPYSSFRESKQQAIRAIITKYLNGELVPVVRCRDCVNEQTCRIAQKLGEDGFCSYGERKK